MLVVLSEDEHKAEDFDLDPEVLSGLWRMEERHFWHEARNGWITRALDRYGLKAPARLLEVGCGSGAVAGTLQRLGYSVVGVDTAGVLVRKAHERCPEATFMIGRVDQVAPDAGPFDAVGFFDVLEHLDDPDALMRAALAHARPGALVVATVPARRALFSVVDELSGHKRRYELGELGAAFARHGLVEIEEHGIFRSIQPLLRVRRAAGTAPSDPLERRRILVGESRIPPFPLNGLLRLICQAEARLGFAASSGKIGPTLLVVGRVPPARH
jgi:SAM-dependent methyltransferase